MNPTSRANHVWLVLLALFWAFYGLLGRDAWKGEEALALAPILEWLAGERSLWATPAPLYSLASGLTASLNPGDVQDGIRLASGVFTVLALLFIGMTGRALFGAGFGAAAVLALLGGLGLMLRAHALLPETALLATWALLLYGVASARQHAKRGALVMGLALTCLGLGLRGLPDLAAGLLMMLLPLLSPSWPDKAYRRAVRQALLLGMGLLALGLFVLWQLDQLSGWLASHGPARLMGILEPAQAFQELPWFAWPLWPLAGWAIWHSHRHLARSAELHPPLIALLVLALAALFPAWSRDGALLPLLLPLALLAAYAVEHLRRGAAQAFYWFGVLCFLFFVLAFWVYFAAIEWGVPAKLASRVARLTPAYQPGSVDTAAILLAAGATLVWLVAIPMFPRAKTRPVLVWATGMAISWVLIAALYRPWIEAGWAYRPLIRDMARHLPMGACLEARVDPAMAAMLHYHLKVEQRTGCAYVLTVANRRDPSEGTAALWQGTRPRYKNQIYRLAQRGQD
ncbi:MAG: hypothetical protein AB1899_08345 [Pseudomonadota bacterium]